MGKGLETIHDVIIVLKSAHRQGAAIDEPEGARYIVLSDTLAIEMVIALETSEKRHRKELEILG